MTGAACPSPGTPTDAAVGIHWADWRRTVGSAATLSPAALGPIRRIEAAASGYADPGDDAVVTLDALDDDDRAALATVLGDGECRAVVAGAVPTEIVETAFAGIWRIAAPAGDGAVCPRYEIGTLPATIRAALAAHRRDGADAAAVPPEGGDGMALATITDIAAGAAAWRPGDPPTGLNLAHVPYSPQGERQILDWLGRGPVVLHSAGSFAAEVALSRWHPVWLCRLSDMTGRTTHTLVEITDTPSLIAAPAADIRQAGRRLAAALDEIRRLPAALNEIAQPQAT